jgi:hypothetical protein
MRKRDAEALDCSAVNLCSESGMKSEITLSFTHHRLPGSLLDIIDQRADNVFSAV